MRSEIISMYDLGKAVSEWNWVSSADEMWVQECMYQVALKYRRYENVGEVWKGDVVTVEMHGTTKKFDRTVKLRVGDNMFDGAFEASLIDKRVGERYSFETDGADTEYIIKDAVRLIVPAVSDEMAAAEGIEGVTTESGLYDYYLKKSLKEKLYNETYGFLSEYLKKCEFSIADSDLDEMCEHEMERCRKISETQNLVFDEMSEEQLLGAVGCGTIEQFKAMIRGYFGSTLRLALVNARLSGNGGDSLSCENIPVKCAELRGYITELIGQKVE